MRNDSVQPFFEIPYYHDYISPTLGRHLLGVAKKISGVDGLVDVGARGGLETTEALQFLVELYQEVKTDLALVLKRRIADRQFVDERVKACYEYNQKLGIDLNDVDYKTIIGLVDAEGRIVVGPKGDHYCRGGGKPVAEIPEYLRGPHVTLFGPPDSAKMAINAMNAYHRKLKGEPAIVEELLSTQKADPKWGADDEDSKTPLRQDLIDAAVNLTGCFDRTLRLDEGKKTYELAQDHLSAPMKRFPGLALPSTFLFYRDNPIPLHLYDFALHLFKNWHNRESLAFYVPKLENEEEARYIHKMIATGERIIQKLHPQYKLGSIRIMIVLENPRAILRAHEIMDELHPYFVGASLGWHDYLGSTARLFKEDGNYRIPVKADPYIVIKYIKASHSLLADVVGSRGGIKVGGMYGILPAQAEIDSPSFQITLKGYFKDVVTQLKRDLTGFWVAHPDFVRLGLAIVEAWKRYEAGDETSIFTLTQNIFQEKHRVEIDEFIRKPDSVGLDQKHPNYVRSLLVADIKESDYIANNHPDEVRYNVFQSLQYLTDWLCGNGCVALPTTIEGVAVRVMDDLATAERSRWEVWHELRHGRFKLEDFLRIACEELRFIRKDLSDEKKIVQVKWDERTAVWYPVALRLMVQLMTAKNPMEFATELLMPFTLEEVRKAKDPWAALQKIDPEKYRLDPYVHRWLYYFERCGSQEFATAMARQPICDVVSVLESIKNFSLDQVNEAASFHGDIGEAAKTLDAMAKAEQKAAHEGAETTRETLRRLGREYREKFGFKFLVSAKGKSADELLKILEMRLGRSKADELTEAKLALWEITAKRIAEEPLDDIAIQISKLLEEHQTTGMQIAIACPEGIQSLGIGDAVAGEKKVTPDTMFEIASLSKTLASAFAMEFMRDRGIDLTTPVNQLFAEAKSDFRLTSSVNGSFSDEVTVAQLMSHLALNMHYVKGFPLDKPMPKISELAKHPESFGYEKLDVKQKPGTIFQYSGGGFIVLEHLIETLSGKKITELTEPFFKKMQLNHITFEQKDVAGFSYAQGYFDDGKGVANGRLMFPAFAAGAMGTAGDMMQFMRHLKRAYRNIEGSGAISHDTARQMLHGKDFGAREFMAASIGLGVFVTEAGDNRIAIHQGSNEGFRAVYVYAYDGPDRGRGFAILCNGDNRSVLTVASVAQVLLKHLDYSGINFSAFKTNFDKSQYSQEQIVNMGYKQLVFSAFKPMLPDAITGRNAVDPLAKYNVLSGAKVVSATNQRFASADNLVSDYEPVFDPTLFCAQGKVMDSWETVRHNPLPTDVAVFSLAKPSKISFIKISTKYHDGNQAPAVSIKGRANAQDEWREILPRVTMDGHSYRLIKLANPTAICGQIWVEMYPDGGLTRLGLYEDVPASEKNNFVPLAQSKAIRFAEEIPKSHKPLTIAYAANTKTSEENLRRAKAKGQEIDYASAAFGGSLVKATNEHYGPAVQVISPFPPIHMFDGLESARSRVAGHKEEVVLKLAAPIQIERVVFDFEYFVNNNPVSVEMLAWDGKDWVALGGKIPVKAFAANKREVKVDSKIRTDQLMVRTYPDGGVNRIHVYGKE